MYKSNFLLSILFFITFTAAWPWPPSFRELVGRDDSTTTSATATASASSAAASSSPAAASSSPAAASSSSGASGTSSPTKTGTSATKTTKGTGSTKATKTHGPTSINPVLPAGGVQMLEPTATLPASFYKIGEPVSFAWNYTSLIITPSAVDVLVSCSSIDATYTVTTGMKIDASATASVVWDTAPDVTGSNPLLTEHYTLIVYEAGTAITAVAKAGYLAPYSQFQFAMYLPQAPTALAEFVCATCSGAMSDIERQTLKFLFGMSIATVFSFSWFAGGFLAYF